MDDIYEEAFERLSELLEKTVSNFAKAYEVNTMIPLFSVANGKLRLLDSVDQLSKYQLIDVCKDLFYKVVIRQGIRALKSEVGNIDFIIANDNYIEGFCVLSSARFTPDIECAINRGITKVTNVVLQEAMDDVVFYKPNDKKYKEYKYKKYINNITVRQFYNQIGANDYEDFLELVEKYNYYAEQLLGLTVANIPTEKELIKHKEKIQKNLKDGFFYSVLVDLFSEQEINQLSEHYMKNCDVMLNEEEFSNSFISSEWYYASQVKTASNMDYTAIIVGYLKSVEQLLFSVLLSLSDECDFYFFTTKNGEKETGKKKLVLSNENQKLLKTMAGNILNVIDSKKNIVMRRLETTDRALLYLKEYFEEIRNSYLHKDNLYILNDIDYIRKKTFGAYFIILSSMNYML